MYYGTHLCKLKKNRLFIPDSLVGRIISNSIVDKNYQRYLNTFGEQYKLEGESIPFISCLDSKSEHSPNPLKFLDRLYLFGNSFIFTDKLTSFLDLSDKVVLIGHHTHFELWNPEHPEKVFSALEAQAALPESRKALREIQSILNNG